MFKTVLELLVNNGTDSAELNELAKFLGALNSLVAVDRLCGVTRGGKSAMRRSSGKIEDAK